MCVHAVDFGTGTTFTGHSDGFLTALADEIRARRGLTHLPDASALGPWL
ncbi:hypothetical protein [Streptomyces sp. NPDC059224]